MKLAEAYKLDEKTVEFVNIDVTGNNDTRNFMSPSLIGNNKSDFYDYNVDVLVYMNDLLEFIRCGNNVKATELCSGFCESDINRLGMSKKGNAKHGKGIGSILQKSLVEDITSQNRVKNGEIFTFKDIELFVKGIGPDRTSDLISALTIESNSKFTERMIIKYHFQKATIMHQYYNKEKKQFDFKEFTLIEYGGDYFILTPKAICRSTSCVVNGVTTRLQEYFNKNHDSFKSIFNISDDEFLNLLRNGKITKKVIKKYFIKFGFSFGKIGLIAFFDKYPEIKREFNAEYDEAVNIEKLNEI